MTAQSEQAPEILFAHDGESIVIALPELLRYHVTRDVLMKSLIVPLQATTFIFPGVVLSVASAAYFVPAAELVLFEGTAGAGSAVNFTSAGTNYSIPETELAKYTQSAKVHSLEPLGPSDPATAFTGSLLRDRQGNLYYLATGALGSFTSFSTALRGSPGPTASRAS